MPRDHSMPPAARWTAVAVLGSLGTLGVVRGLGTHNPQPLHQTPSTHTAATDAPTDPAAPATPDPTPTTTSPTRLINVNTASAAELDLLPGIGPTLAARILAHRETNGPYTTLDDLDDVSGIGPKTIANLAPYATAE